MLYDRRLTDPAPKELLAALADAVKLVRPTLRAWESPPDLAGWREAVVAVVDPEGVLTTPEPGRRDLTGPLAVAWWTDAHGRRSWRVVARSVASVPPAWPVDRPALWWVFPERLYMRTDGAAPRLVAACACGNAGDPASLGWTGPRCGPCEDHRAERAAARLPPPPEPAAVIAGPAVRRMRFSRDGQWLVGSFYRWLAGWEVATGRQAWAGPINSLFDFTADGRWLVSIASGGRVTLRAVGDWSRVSVGVVLGWPRAVACLAGGNLAVVADGRLRVIDPLTGEGPSVPVERCPVLTADPGGDFYAESSGRTTRYTPDLREVWQRNIWGLMSVSPDGMTLAARDSGLSLWSAVTGVALATLPVTDGAHEADFSPDSRRLITCGRGGVELWSPAEGRRLARWQWHAGPPAALALSPDGRTLATAGEGVMKLWPWADLPSD